jgi:DNA ligase-associated metallophosphoesterase
MHRAAFTWVDVQGLSISGFDVQKAAITLRVAPEPQSNRMVGSGHAGCNSWSANVVLREEEIDITNMVTSRKFRGKPRMTSEEALLTSLKSAQRWRLDDKSRLIIEGEAAWLLLTAGRADKQPEKKSGKKSAKPKRAARKSLEQIPLSAFASQVKRASVAASPGLLAIAGVELVADPSGALFWPEEGLLAVADLHLEKGSSFAERRVLLPPYDTAATLGRLTQLIARYAPRAVAALGDSFHDRRGPSRLNAVDRGSIMALQRGRDWIWIAGNHDPDPAEDIGGRFAAAFMLGPLTFRHQPDDGAEGEISGHLHPIARVAKRGRAVSRRCFACDGKRAVMPAFGAYAGGLNVRDRAFAAVFETLAFTAHMLGERRIYAVAAKQCLPD